MPTFLSKIMDSAQDVRVSDSNERLNEYIQGVLRKSDLESFVAIAPRRDGYRIYVGEDMENPFAYVDVYLDGESLVVEGSSKRHLSDAEMGDLARFLGINGKEAGEKLNRFRKFVDLLRSESGKSVDDLKDAKVSDSGNKSWPEEYREKLHAVSVPEKRGRLTEQEEQDIMDRRNGIAVSSVTQLLNSMGYDAKGEEMDITVRGNEKSAEIRVGGLHNSDGFLAINVEGGRTEYFDITDAESWINYLRTALGGFVKDSDVEGFDVKDLEGVELSEEEKLGGKLPSDDEMLDMLRADASPKTLSRIARVLKEQGRTSLKDGNTEVMAIAEYPNGALVYSFKQKAWQEAVKDSCKKVKDSDDESYKEGLRTIYESYEDGSIMGAELEEELERFVDDNDIPSDMVSEIYERIDEFTIARKHASRDGGRTPDGRDEFHSWFESFYSKVCDSKEVKDSDAEGIVENDTEGVTEESLNEAIRKAGEETKTDLTEEEKRSGDYPKGVVEVQGMSIAIENPKGSTRSGVDADGNEWSTEMQDTYGYFEGTAGADTDDIDVFVGEHPLSDKVFIVDQVKEDGSFDEHKVMFGYESSEDAREAYLRNYEDGWQGLGSITQVGVEDFRRWVEADKTRDKAFTEYIKVQDSNVRPQDFGQTHRIKVDGVYYTNGNTITVDGKQGRVTRFGKDSAEVRLDDGSTITVKGEVTKIPDSMSEGGVSTTKSGEEKYEKFTTRVGRKSRTMYQYDYRTPDGELFSCVAPSLESCRAKRDAWLEKRGQKVQDTMNPNEDKDENINVGWSASALEKRLHRSPVRRGSKVSDSDKERISLSEIERSQISSDSMPSFIKIGSRKYTKTGSDEWTGAKTARSDESKYTNKQMYDKVQAAVILEVPVSEELSMRTVDSASEKYWSYSFDTLGEVPILRLLGRRTEREVEDLLSRGDIKVYPFMFPSKQSYDHLIEQASGPHFNYEIDRSMEVLDSTDDYQDDSFIEVEVSVSFAKKFGDMLRDLRHMRYTEEATNVFHIFPDSEDVDDDTLMELRDVIYENMDSYSIPRDEVFLHISDCSNSNGGSVVDSKELPRRDFVFPADSTMVNDGKGHFPLNSLNRGRAALAFVARYDKLPKWYSGDMSLEEFKDHVRSEVKKAYPSIEVSDSVESGSGSFDFNEVYHDLDVALQKVRQYLIGKEAESMADEGWDIASVGSAISRAMRYLHEAARKQGQTTDYTKR